MLPRVLCFAVALLASGPAAAVVVFDPLTRQGMVDLADVQQALGWDSSFAQQAAPTIGFSMEEQGTRSWECVWTANGATFRVPRSVTTTTSVPLETRTVPSIRNPTQVAAFRITGLRVGGAGPDGAVVECLSVHPAAVVIGNSLQPSGPVSLYVNYPESSSNRVLLRTF